MQLFFDLLILADTLIPILPFNFVVWNPANLSRFKHYFPLYARGRLGVNLRYRRYQNSRKSRMGDLLSANMKEIKTQA
jgi:hypothetical protein